MFEHTNSRFEMYASWFLYFLSPFHYFIFKSIHHSFIMFYAFLYAGSDIQHYWHRRRPQSSVLHHRQLPNEFSFLHRPRSGTHHLHPASLSECAPSPTHLDLWNPNARKLHLSPWKDPLTWSQWKFCEPSWSGYLTFYHPWRLCFTRSYCGRHPNASRAGTTWSSCSSIWHFWNRWDKRIKKN